MIGDGFDFYFLSAKGLSQDLSLTIDSYSFYFPTFQLVSETWLEFIYFFIGAGDFEAVCFYYGLGFDSSLVYLVEVDSYYLCPIEGFGFVDID